MINHATLFVPFDFVSVLSCIEMKEVGRGECFSTTGLRLICTGPDDLVDVVQMGVFRFLRKRVFAFCVLQVFEDPFYWSRDHVNLTQISIWKEEAAVVLRLWCRG